MAFYSPLRYPGGKGKVAGFFHAIIEENSLHDGTYVEPYAGGASVALSLLFNEYVSSIVINDMDRSIYAIWHSILNKNDEFCKKISKTKVNLDVWEECRLIQKRKNRARLFDLGFSTFFLNRTNRSGIIKGGIIGGKSQTGKWKIDARFNKDDLIERIKRIGQYRDRVKIYNLDAYELLNRLSPTLTNKDICYLDPPYYEKGKELYVNYYKEADHLKISKLIKSTKKVKWAVSYDNKDKIKDMYKQCHRIEYNLNYSVSLASMGTEVMFFSKGLKLSENATSCLRDCNYIEA
jgi:DNA adenine methylase